MFDVGSQAIAVVVVTHQSAAHLPALLGALLGQLGEQDELVIVDNASSDDTAAVARTFSERVRVIETAENLGFAGGCHVGADATRRSPTAVLEPRLPTPARQHRATARRSRHTPRLGSLAGGRAARGRRHQHQRRRRALPRHRLGGGLRTPTPRTAHPRYGGCLSLGRGHGRAPSALGSSWAAWTASTSCTARISTWDCACG